MCKYLLFLTKYFDVNICLSKHIVVIFYKAFGSVYTCKRAYITVIWMWIPNLHNKSVFFLDMKKDVLVTA